MPTNPLTEKGGKMNTRNSTYVGNAKLAGIHAPRLVVNGILQVVLLYKLFAAPPALGGNTTNHCPVTQINTKILLVVGCTSCPRPTACMQLPLLIRISHRNFNIRVTT